MEKHNKIAFWHFGLGVVIAFLLFTILCLTIFYATWFSGRSITNYYVENFENYKTDYSAICDEIVKMSNHYKISVNPKENYYWIHLKCNNNQNFLCCYDGASSNKEYFWEVSEALLKNKSNIAKSFPNEAGYSFTSIMYTENRISFHSENGHYAIVYSVDEKKPTFWLTSSEEDDIKVKKITKNWYHMWR